MGYTQVRDTIFSDSIRMDSVWNDSLIGTIQPFLSGSIPYQATEVSQQANPHLLANQPIWFFIVIFSLIVSIAASQLFFGKLLKGTFQAAARYSVTVGMFNDNSQIQRRKDNILYAVYFVSLAFFMLLMEMRFSIFPFRLFGFVLFLCNIAFLVVIFYLRIIFANLAAHIFNKYALFREYLYHNFAVNKLFGLLLIPLIFLLTYTRETINDVCFWVSISLFGAMLVMKIFKGIIFSLKKHVFSFYLFLYLCALEIVPILLIYKWISSVV